MQNNRTDRIPDAVTLCADGKYRWAFELNLYRNPTVLFLLWQIFGVICAALWVFVTLLSVGNSGFWWHGFTRLLIFFLLFTAGLFVLCALGYFVYALIMGGKYCVLFEMDEQGVRHTQMETQVKKAEVIGSITTLFGVAANNPTVMGIGLLSSSKASVYSEFGKVRRMKVCPRRGVIKLRTTFSGNQIYAEKEAFPFVLSYIRTYVR